MLIYHYKMRDRNEQKKRTAKARRKEGHEAEKKQETNYKALTVPELKKMAKDDGIEGYAHMRKNELIAALE